MGHLKCMNAGRVVQSVVPYPGWLWACTRLKCNDLLNMKLEVHTWGAKRSC